MTIILTTPIQYPDSLEARISAIIVDILDKRCEMHIQLGYRINGNFESFLVKQLIFRNDQLTGENKFTELIQSVPDFKNLRKSLEQYLSDNNIFGGTVT